MNHEQHNTTTTTPDSTQSSIFVQVEEKQPALVWKKLHSSMKTFKVSSKSLLLVALLGATAASVATSFAFAPPIILSKNNINNNSVSNNQFFKLTTATSTAMKASSSSADQEEAKKICPLLPSPVDPHTTFEAAMGWFWGPQRDFDQTEGITNTVVGYSGSVSRDKIINPTYRNICDYAESIRITYNDDKLKYEDLLEMFFDMHTPSDSRWGGTQYRSAIFVYTDEQKALAEIACKKRGSIGDMVKIEYASDFYRGEEYHQKYVEKATARRYA
jgi:peptide-methionine (S)-S-oxide reductase